MEKKEFKRTFNDCLLSNGFYKKGKYYYKESLEVICSLGLQKSYYSNSYYINLGIIIKEVNNKQELFSDVDGDIRYRFYSNFSDKNDDLFDLDIISDSGTIISILKSNIDEIVNPSLNIISLKELLKNKPFLLFQTNIKAKQYLGI